ncbi:MAG: hypothetical protein OHK0053_06880 [Microscillaceae bacterium]
MKNNKQGLEEYLGLEQENQAAQLTIAEICPSEILEAYGHTSAFAQVLALGQRYLHPRFSPEKAAELACQFADIVRQGPSHFPKTDFWHHNLLAAHFEPLLRLMAADAPPSLPGALSWPSASLSGEVLRFGFLAARFYARHFLKMAWEEGLPSLLLQPPPLALETPLNEIFPSKKIKGAACRTLFVQTEDLSTYCFYAASLALKKNRRTFKPELVWSHWAHPAPPSRLATQGALFDAPAPNEQVWQKLRVSPLRLVMAFEKISDEMPLGDACPTPIWISYLQYGWESLAEEGILAYYLRSFQADAEWQAWVAARQASWLWWAAPDSTEGWLFVLKQARSSGFFSQTLVLPDLSQPRSAMVWQRFFEEKYSPPAHVKEAPTVYVASPAPASETALPLYLPLYTSAQKPGIFRYCVPGLSIGKAQHWHHAQSEILARHAREHLSQTLAQDPQIAKRWQKTAWLGREWPIFRPQQIQEFYLHPLQTAFFYAEPALWPEGNLWEKVFRPGFENVYLLWGEGGAWAVNKPINRLFAGKTWALPRFQLDWEGQASDNISPEALRAFKAYYESQWQNRLGQLESHFHFLLDLQFLESCPVEPELALDLRPLALFGEDFSRSRFLLSNFAQPDERFMGHFKAFSEAFHQARRAFEQTGKRACRGREGFLALQHYFQRGEVAFRAAQEYLQESQFRPLGLEREIESDDIFHYTYAVLCAHTGLEAEAIPAIPLYRDFWSWVGWGKALLALHLEPSPSPLRGLSVQERYLRKPQRRFSYTWQPTMGRVVLQGGHAALEIKKISPEAWDFRLGKYNLWEWAWQDFGQEIVKNAEFLIQASESIHQRASQIGRLVHETLQIRKLMAYTQEF